MINFFRKIRKRLTEENKFVKYLLYAFGEIALIVIGILLALYLDNLNTEKKLRINEIKVLNELKSNLNSSINAFERSILAEKNYLKYNFMIIDNLDNKKVYNDSLDEAYGTYFWTISSNPVSGAYENLKSKGIDLITNDSLRKNISFIFENEFLILKEENEVWANNLQQNISYPYHINHFIKYFPEESDSDDYQVAKPIDYEALLVDNKFKSINAEIIANRKWNINSLQNIIEEAKDIMMQIDKETRNLESE